VFVLHIDSAWRWYAASAICLVFADRLAGWLSLIPLTIGIACGICGLTSYAQGRDGLSKYRQ
jgi:hypothetical protein